MSHNTNQDASSVSVTLKAAFKLMDTSDKSGTQATQTLAMVAMIAHKQLITGNDDIAAWPNFITSTKATTHFVNKVFALAGYMRPDVPKDDKTEKHVMLTKQYNAQAMAMRRAVVLAAELQCMGVDELQFNDAKRLFALQADKLCGHDDVATGKLLDKKKASDDVLLDGTAYYVMRGNKLVSINASVSQVIKAARSHREGSTTTHKVNNRVSSGQGDTGNVWKDKDFTGCLVQAVRILDEDDAPVKWSELDDSTRNAIERIRLFADQAHSLDMPIKTTKPRVAATKKSA